MNWLTQPLGGAIDAIRVKSITQEMRKGRRCMVRRRGAIAIPLVHTANFFFRIIRNPVRVCTSHAEWMEWEVRNFQLLNGSDYIVFAEPPRAVVTEELPGQSLAWHFEQGSFREEMLASAALELKRCHQLPMPELNGAWSHGDANLTNFLFDPETRRTRIIDFEIIPDGKLSGAERHAEDLLVFLQDLCGCIAAERWGPAALLFLQSYHEPEVTRILKTKLVIPPGIPRLWWWIRCNSLPIREIETRFEQLARQL